MDDFTIYDSLNNIIKVEHTRQIDFFVYQSIYVINIAKKIKPIYISKELGIKLRNLKQKEINHIYKNIKNELEESMDLGYDKLKEYELHYDINLGEIGNINKMDNLLKKQCFYEYRAFLKFIYAKSISLNVPLNEKTEYVLKEDFENREKFLEKLAKSICSKMIVLEIEDYDKLYKIMDNYYNLDNQIYKKHIHTEKFIYNFMKLCNIIYLMTDSHRDERKFDFKIVPFERFEFKIFDIVEFFDGYFHNDFDDNKLSNKLKTINPNLIDSYIKDNKENINNLAFIVSKLYTTDDKSFEFNYKEYNLNLISIIELLLVNSRQNDGVKEKFIKNILLCLAINNSLGDKEKECNIIKEIYLYRSRITHGNYNDYKNSLKVLEKILNYKPMNYEKNKTNTIEYLISQKLNFYIKNIFEVNSMNSNIINILKQLD